MIALSVYLIGFFLCAGLLRAVGMGADVRDGCIPLVIMTGMCTIWPATMTLIILFLILYDKPMQDD